MVRFLSPVEAIQLDTLTEELSQSSCADDFELILSLAFLQRNLNQLEAFKKTIKLVPQIRNFVGSLVKRVQWFIRAYEVIADRITFDLIPLIVNVVFIMITFKRYIYSLGSLTKMFNRIY